MEFNLCQIIIVYLCVIAGAVCQSSLSMGFALFTAPVLLIINPDFVPGSIVLGGLVISLLMIVRDKETINFHQGIWLAISGRVFGTILAGLVLLAVSGRIFGIIFSGCILLAVGMSLAAKNLEPTRPKLVAAGFLSGFMGTVSAIGGPPMGLLYQNKKSHEIRGALTGFYAVGMFLSLLTLIFTGRFGWTQIKLFIFIMPGILGGFFLSPLAIRFIDRGFTKYIILIISCLAIAIFFIKEFLIH